MKTFISKEFEFSAHHRLPFHQGKCKRNHGHNYILEVLLSGEVQGGTGNSAGMIIDFYDLSTIVKERIIDIYDHYSMNDDLHIENPTAEIMAAQIFEALDSTLPATLERIRLWETPKSYAEVVRDHIENSKGEN